ncbi:MAG TPA: hypothetical protein VHT00_04145 [Stellaceae bacterium]|jgi:hypothetical protein|nr:hypothetical protein [Stellaceae bacterium]
MLLGLTPFSPALRKLVVVLAALFAFPFSSRATVIVSVTDLGVPFNRAAFFLGGEFSNAVAVSWTQADSFSGVSIDASLASSDPSFDTGTAYLMRSIGPGTTPASEVVPPAIFTAPIQNQLSEEVPLTVLFSGLTLDAGSYFLVLTAPFADIMNSPLFWQIATEPDVITTTGVTIGNTNLANTFYTTVDPFAPASAFLVDLVDRPLFDVVSNTSEPQTAVLLLTFVAVLILGMRRNSHDRKSKLGL